MFFQNNKSALTSEIKSWVLQQLEEFDNAGYIKRVDYIPIVFCLYKSKKVALKSSLFMMSPLRA